MEIRRGRGLVLAAFRIAAAGASAAAESVSLSMWAVQATQESRENPFYEPGLEAIKEAVSGLPFNTYRKIQTTRQAAPFNEKTRFSINDRYTLLVTPLSKDEDGRIRVELCVLMASKDPEKDTVKALESRLVVPPDKNVNLHGFKLEEGELVIVLAAKG